MMRGVMLTLEYSNQGITREFTVSVGCFDFEQNLIGFGEKLEWDPFHALVLMQVNNPRHRPAFVRYMKGVFLRDKLEHPSAFSSTIDYKARKQGTFKNGKVDKGSQYYFEQPEDTLYEFTPTYTLVQRKLNDGDQET